jgi:GDPmannose 4,6-dehydratase
LQRAVIVGCAGQDGRLLFELLEEQAYSIVGLMRGGVRSAHISATVDPVDVLDSSQVGALLDNFRPHEIYYLAAHHQASETRMYVPRDVQWQLSFDVHVKGLLSFLEGIRTKTPESRLFYACSSLVFGNPLTSPQTERTPLDPRSAYGITKAAGLQCCRMYRAASSVFASAGILYNHESPFRPEAFVSQKIVRGALRIQAGLQNELLLGDLSAEVDWGWAPDYVRAMPAILGLPAPDDFVIATGVPHRVSEFARIAFEAVGLDWESYTREQPSLVAEPRSGLVGDASKLQHATGWTPSVSFEDMVRLLVVGAR